MAPKGKKTVTPAFTGRRSKAERDALENAAKQRDQARRDALEKEDRDVKKERMMDQNRRGGHKGGQARGGYSGVSTGPFSMGSASQDRRKAAANAHSSGSRATRVKSEKGDSGGGSSSGTRTRGDHGDDNDDGEDAVFSDNDEEAEVPRKNVDFIEISDDDGPLPTPEKILSPKTPGSATLPVRIGRKEHLERGSGIVTDTNAANTTQGDEGESPISAIKIEGLDGASRKGKGKAKDVEITEVRRPYKGVWQDEEAPPAVSVKTEPVSDNEDVTPIGNLEDTIPIGNLEDASPPIEISDAASPESKKKAKSRRKPMPQPALQTYEDREEWERYLADCEAIMVELGPGASTGESSTDGVDGGNAAGTTEENNPRENNVYLFQMPPIMPDLVPAPNTKGEAKDAKDQTPSMLHPTATTTKGPQVPPIKVEEGASKQPNEAPGPRVVPGKAGKMRVRANGQVEISWGGTPFQVVPAQQVDFLQEAVSVNIVPPAQRVAPEDAGDVCSFGRIKGKFVVVPDWEKLL